ncbi:divergent polysaccharide deacetylase family protein [Pseudomonas aeruginosa]|uniref:divergent polysaccharide deacetylase family protein n=1 Tax=Pseudomonas aeruginosa TaxID=287 RepID=UPI004053D5DE
MARDRRVLDLPPGVTLAIIPETPHAAELAREAHQRGRTVILHMPMDPAGGPYAWRPELTQEERARRLDAALAKVPFVQGLNNHEGSRMTAVRPAMAWLAEELQRRGLYLVDSRTSAATVAASEAQRIGLASVSRDVFLDNEATPEAVSAQLQAGVALAGLWNGAWFLGDAGLLDGYRCCIHPEHRAALAEIARNSQVTSDSYMVDRDRLTAASPTGAFNLALEWIARRHGRDLVEAVVDILAFEESRYRRVRPALHEKMSEPLREVINLMAANIEEPLSQEQLAHYVGRSRRQIERLFQQQLGTTPVRYYLELRITECRRLLQHSDLTMLEVLVACGFVSPSHFSKCYTAFYGYPPSKEVRYGNVRSTK